MNDVVYRANFIRYLYENVFRKLFIGIAYADFKPSDLSHIMVCGSSNPYPNNNSGAYYYTMWDASNDDSSIESSKTLKNSSNNDYIFDYFIFFRYDMFCFQYKFEDI